MTFVWDSSADGALTCTHVQTTEKEDCALQPWFPRLPHKLGGGGRELQGQVFNALVIMKITGWLRGVSLSQGQSFN